jgi:hypothetical protein
MVENAPLDVDVVNDPQNPLGSRVAKHIYATLAVARSYGESNPAKVIVVSGLPAYEDLVGNGLGPYLR